MRSVTVHDLHALCDQGEVCLIDVREPGEFAAGRVPGARLVPLASVPQVLPELPRDQVVYVVCASGQRSAYAARWLVGQGFDAANVEGGTQDWAASGYPVQR